MDDTLDDVEQQAKDTFWAPLAGPVGPFIIAYDSWKDSQDFGSNSLATIIKNSPEATAATQNIQQGLTNLGNSIEDALPSKTELVTGAAVIIVVLFLLLLLLGKVEAL